MAVSELTRIVPPPAKPRYAGTEKQWAKFEAELPFRLPRDYRRFIQRYGVGDLRDMFYVFSPFEPKYSFLDCYTDIDGTFWEACELENHFKNAQFGEAPRLIRFGGDTSCSYLYWLTDGRPDKWPIIVGPPIGWPIDRFPGPFTSFLANAFRGKMPDLYSLNILKRVFIPGP